MPTAEPAGGAGSMLRIAAMRQPAGSRVSNDPTASAISTTALPGQTSSMSSSSLSYG